jgi:predicted ATP-dependent serine protease
VGLGGEIRGVDQLEKRLHECAQAGFTRCLVPARNVQSSLQLPASLELVGVSTLSEAIEAGLPPAPRRRPAARTAAPQQHELETAEAFL